MKNVVIIEDQTAIRDMLEMVLATLPGFELVGSAGEGHMGWELCIQKSPDLLILDIMLPGLNGVEILRRIPRQFPTMRALVFSGHQSAGLVKETVRAGAHGFVEKTASLAELKRGIEVVADGGSYFGPMIAVLLREVILNSGESANTAETLTAREREVFQLIAESCSTKEVANRLSISVKTADNHRTNLMRKLNLHNVASLTRYAMQIGLINDDLSPRHHP
jgi:DNA-binding NarL/FixJ family response regulator